jgi:hypothetical protein
MVGSFGSCRLSDISCRLSVVGFKKLKLIFAIDIDIDIEKLFIFFFSDFLFDEFFVAF